MESSPKPLVMSADGVLVQDFRSPKEILWEKYTTLPLIFLSFLFLLGYSFLILSDEVHTQGIDFYIYIGLIVIWVVFIVDYFVRLAMANSKRPFVRKNIIDLISLLIPFVRPFLLLLYLSRSRFFRGKKGSSVRARMIAYAASFSIMYIYILSLAVYSSERSAPGASITSYGDSVWWAMETISTVGYGDMVPVTIPGRIYASMLMLGGMVIVGATTATVVSFLAEKVNSAHKKSQELTGTNEHQSGS